MSLALYALSLTGSIPVSKRLAVWFSVRVLPSILLELYASSLDVAAYIPERSLLLNSIRSLSFSFCIKSVFIAYLRFLVVVVLGVIICLIYASTIITKHNFISENSPDFCSWYFRFYLIFNQLKNFINSIYPLIVIYRFIQCRIHDIK